MNEEKDDSNVAIPLPESENASEDAENNSRAIAATTSVAAGAEQQTKTTAAPLKKPRKRKKQIYNLIRLQMEFYFSDANLSKDRFLKKLIAEDPC